MNCLVINSSILLAYLQKNVPDKFNFIIIPKKERALSKIDDLGILSIQRHLGAFLGAQKSSKAEVWLDF